MTIIHTFTLVEDGEVETKLYLTEELRDQDVTVWMEIHWLQIHSSGSPAMPNTWREAWYGSDENTEIQDEDDEDLRYDGLSQDFDIDIHADSIKITLPSDDTRIKQGVRAGLEAAMACLKKERDAIRLASSMAYQLEYDAAIKTAHLIQGALGRVEKHMIALAADPDAVARIAKGVSDDSR